MRYSLGRRAKVLVLLILASYGCQSIGDEKTEGPPPPLVDTLEAVFAEMHEAVRDNDADRFLSLLDPNEAEGLADLTRRHGFSSIRTYLERQFVHWPDLDTLEFEGLTSTGNYARLTLQGPGSQFGRDRQMVHYTFLLFRRGSAGWRLTAMASLEKERYDRYGHEISYHETDLPPKLRFPRRF